MLLNCDLGESYGRWTMGMDAMVMPHIDQANIACGFHGGDPLTMRKTLELAAMHGVSVGAHPAYPDLAGFGRRSMQLSQAEIIANLHYQVAALEGMAQNQGLTVAHVKPHGALYNDMMTKPGVRSAIMEAMAGYHRPLTLVMQATPAADDHRAEAQAAGVELLFEVFADRCYNGDGTLVARSQANAVHNRELMLAQVQQLQQDQSVSAPDGSIIALQADTLCVHGDNPEGVRAIEEIRALVKGG
jgi:UPF0271 protein